MKENLLGPHKWALVVISGGAACALPFVHRDKPTNPTPIHSQRETNFDPGGVGIAHASVDASATGNASGVSLPTPQLPEWANADRSPFDDLVGITATPSAPKVPDTAPPMQPLRPWITGPNEFSASTDSRQSSPSTSPSPFTQRQDSVVTSSARPNNWSEADASPWADPPEGSSSRSESHRPSPNAIAQASTQSALPASDAWPDQKLSSEEIGQLTRAAPRELASAVVSPAPSLQAPAQLLEPPRSHMVPSLTHNPSTRPGPAQLHFGQAPVFLNGHSGDSQGAVLPPTIQSGAATGRPLPKLPETRKNHIIFQPSARR